MKISISLKDPNICPGCPCLDISISRKAYFCKFYKVDLRLDKNRYPLRRSCCKKENK